MQAKIEKVSQKIIEISFYALFFLTPLLWNPYNSELFELPKMFFVWIITIIITGTWVVRSVIHGRPIFRRTPLDLPLLLFLLSQVASYAFSIDHHTSLWGYYSRFNGGLLSIISYCLLYWSFVSNLTLRSTLYALRFLLVSTFLVALYALPAHFGYDPTCFILGRGLNTACWSAQFVPTERIFGTLGQPNWLAAYLVALLPLAVATAVSNGFYLLSINFRKIINTTYYLILIAAILAAIIFTRSQSGFLGLTVAVAVFGFGYFASTHKLHFRKPVIIATSGLLLIVGLITLPRIPSVDRCIGLITNHYSLTTTDITPSADIRCIVWKGAIEIWKHYPIIGSGPETFAFTYYGFKPPEHNLTSEWDFLYNKAHNEFLNYLANTGIAGLAAYLLLIAASVGLIAKCVGFKNTKAKELSEHYALKLALLAGYIAILVTDFFGFSVVPVQLEFFLFPAIALTFTQNESVTLCSKLYALSSKRAVLISIVFLVTCYPLLTTFRYYAADIHYTNSQKLSTDGDYLNSLSAIRKTIELRPDEPVYQNGLTDIASSIAYLAYEQDATLSAQLASLAETASDRSLATSPRNVQSLKLRSNIFITLAGVNTDYLDKAREALEKAQQLAPTDARITYNLGLLYWQTDQTEKAKKQFKKALSLRPNYEEPKAALEELNMGSKGIER